MDGAQGLTARLPTARGSLARLITGPTVLRRSLLWMTLLLTGFGLLGAGLAYELGLREADRLLDEQLKEIAFYAAPGPFVRLRPVRGHSPSHDVLVQIRDSAGTLLYSSDPTLQIPPQAGPGFAVVGDAEENWRSFTATEGDASIQVSQRASVRQELAQTGALEAALPILMTIPLGWIVVGLGLQKLLNSLSSLAGTIATRGVESRSPIGLDDVPAEFTSLVEAMNALIGRWQLSLEQQKQFLSDAAHELRTPLTALRLQIDLLQTGGHGTVELDAVLPELARGAGRASALVDQLLRVARYDADSTATDHQVFDVVGLVIARMADFVGLAESKDIDIGLVSAEPSRLKGGERDIGLLVANLIENAVRYTPTHGVVDIGVRRDGGSLVIEVADTGAGIPDDLLERVFDRFFRAPGAGSEGTGLGLAICEAIVRRHGLSLTLHNRPEGGLMARVSGPAVT